MKVMKMRRRGRWLGRACAAVVAGMVCVNPGQAGQTVDVRAVSVNGNLVNDPKSVTVGAAGDIVRMDVFAQVGGVNGAKDERTFWTMGGFVSTDGMKGSLAAAVVAPFNAAGAQNGTVHDLDGDSDMDVGALYSIYPLNNAFSARTGDASGVETATVVDADTSEIKIAELTFTVSNLGGGPTGVAFVPMENTNNTPFYSGAFWYEDGATALANLKNPTISTYAAGAPVIIAVPELTSAAGVAAAAAGVGLQRRRRR